MTPSARASAAIELLDLVLAGTPAEQALTNWGRRSRFAGSGDRAAVRDLVYDALRCRRSFAALGGGMTGRGLILGGIRAAGGDSGLWFDGGPHAPPAPTADEAGRPPEGAEAHDIPDWLEAPLRDSLGADFDAVMQAMRARAPVGLRVNITRTTLSAAQQALAAEGIVTRPSPLAQNGLEVIEGERKLRNARAFSDGLVELQDAASQAVVEALPLRDGQRVLDLCAGGGGKTLAMAARARLGALWAHDANPRRMADLPARAARAGVQVRLTDNPEKTAPYDLILTDVPCSGSGSWRRDPEGKWALTAARLADLNQIQDAILDRAATMVAPGGNLAYATCSFLRAENEDRITAFLDRNPRWQLRQSRRFSPLQGGDGFFLALLCNF